MDEKDLRLYLDEVRRMPEVRGSAEVELWRVVEGGGSEPTLARDRLIEANLRLAVAVAKKLIGRGRGLLVDSDIKPTLEQGVGSGSPADASTDDRHPQRT